MHKRRISNQAVFEERFKLRHANAVQSWLTCCSKSGWMKSRVAITQRWKQIIQLKF